MALAFVILGRAHDRVLERPGKAADARDRAVTHLTSMPLSDGIREAPRFQALLARMHLA
jgi:hypothetical protein